MNDAAALGTTQPDRFDLWRALSFGMLWGTATTAWSTFDLPLGDIGSMQMLLLLVRVLPVYWLQGIALVAATTALGHRLTPARAVAFVIGFSLLTLPADWLFWAVLALPGRDQLPAWAAQPNYAHTIWQNLVINGLFVAAFKLNAGSQRSHRLLAQAEIARQQSEVWLGVERARALQGQVDPALLLRVMVEVERRYSRDPASAQRLLDSLVGTLRAAMPAVRSGASTIAGEVLLVRQYAALRAELEPGHAAWIVRGDDALPELPFPPLLLLPVLDALIGADEAAAHAAELCVAVAGGRCTLSLVHAGPGHGPWLAADLLFRLQVGLRAVCGEGWTLHVNDRPSIDALVLTLPMPATTATPATPPNRQEATHD